LVLDQMLILAVVCFLDFGHCSFSLKGMRSDACQMDRNFTIVRSSLAF